MRTGSFVRRMVIGSHPIKLSAWNSFRAIIVGYVCLNHGHIPHLGGINYRVWTILACIYYVVFGFKEVICLY